MRTPNVELLYSQLSSNGLNCLKVGAQLLGDVGDVFPGCVPALPNLYSNFVDFFRN